LNKKLTTLVINMTTQKFKKLKILSILALFGFFIVFPFQSMRAQETGAIKPGETVCVKSQCFYMGISKDGQREVQVINLSPQTSEDFINSPFLGDYIASVYKYAIAVITVLAVVFLVIAGLQWAMSGGNSERVSQAKKIIARSLTGLLIALGSYTILFTINPELVKFTSLKLLRVQQVFIDDAVANSLSTTQEDTDPESSSYIPKSHIPTITECPFTLSSTKFKPGKTEFLKKLQMEPLPGQIVPFLFLDLPIRKKIVTIADMAVQCKIELGSCGNTAGTILAAAGVIDKGGKASQCMTGETLSCGNIYKRTKLAISSEQRKAIYSRRCQSKNPINNCANTPKEAIAQLRTYLKEEEKAGRLQGWPDQWAKTLEPGDYVIIYTGNTDQTGSHAIIFLGWAEDGKTMEAVSGTAGKSTQYKNYCIKSACGDSMFPILYIHSPE